MSRQTASVSLAGSVSTLTLLLLAQTFVVGQASAQCVPKPAGLVAWWDADAVAGAIATDLENGNDGTLVGDVTVAPGRVGQSFELDGAGDLIVVGSPSALHLQDFTITAWVKRASATQATLEPFGSSYTGHIFLFGQNGYGLVMDASGELILTKVGVSGIFSSAAHVTDTAWHHVAVSKVGGAITFYVDGAGEAFSGYDPGFTFETNAAIGRRDDNPTNSFFGRIDELQIFDRALSATEIQSIFGAGAAGVCKQPPECAPTPPGLTSWWTGDSVAGTTAIDDAGGNDGQLENGASIGVGLVGNAFSLDGIDDYVAVPDAPSLDFADAAFTWELWFRTTDTTPGVIMTKFDAGPPFVILDDYVALVMASGILELRFSDIDGGVTHSAFTAAAYADGSWHHAAVVRTDPDNAKLYVDGAEAASVTNIADVDLPADGDVLMGGFRYPAQVLGLWGGDLDEVSVYSRDLSSAEIQAIYAAGSAGKCTDPDTDADGLTDPQELALGTDPNDPDSDDDGLLDGTEVDMQTAANPGCPDPLNPDSDGDTIPDGAEVALGTSACDPDTDGDTLPDAIDPLPTDPGITSGVLEDSALGLAEYIATRELALFDAPNNNARNGRRNSMATRVRNAAKKIRQGQFSAAIALLEGVGVRVDGDAQQKDWMLLCDERGVIQAAVVGLVDLLQT